MRKKIMLGFMGLLGAVCFVSAQELSGSAILQAMEETLYPDNYTMTMTMETREASGRTRTLTMESFYRKDTGTYMEILAPARSRGTRFLEKDDTLWMYIPRSQSRSAIRLSPRDSFQGSAFSNDDVGDSSYTEDYRSTLLREEVYSHSELGDVSCYVIEAVPSREEAAYGRIVAWVTKEGTLPLKMDYYVRSGLKTKEMTLSDIQTAAGRRRPLRMEMRSLDEAGKVSVITIKDLQENNDLGDRIFSRTYLTR